MSNKTSIRLTWDQSGHIRHKISGAKLPPPKDNVKLWVLAPSAPFLLAHQFGAMKPSHGLIAAAGAIDIFYHDRFIRMPINSALKGARIDFLYTGGPAVKIKFRPEHGLFANSDSLEEGVRQLLNNYLHYVYAQMDDYTRIVLRTIGSAAIGGYFGFLEDQYKRGRIGKGRDKWHLEFSVFSAQIREMLSKEYYVPIQERTPENEEWARKQTKFLDANRVELENDRDALFTIMGLH